MRWTIGSTRVAQNADGRLEFFGLGTGARGADEIGNIEKYIERRLSPWMNSAEGLQAQRKVLNEFSRRLNPYLQAETDRICTQFQIEKDSLRIDLTLPPDAQFENKVAMLGVLDKSLAKVMLPTVQLVTQVLDKIVPVQVRRLVPKKLIDLYLDSSVFTSEVATSISDNLVRLDPHTERMFVDDVRAEIEKELEARARQAEWLIR